MLIDGLNLIEGSEITNLTVASGTSFPMSPSQGELFFRSDLGKLHIFDGVTWQASDTADVLAGDSVFSGDVSFTGTVAGPTPTAPEQFATKGYVDGVDVTKVDKVVGKGLSTEDYTTAEKTKLSGIAAGATANSTDVQLRDRLTHTGTQAINTVSGLQTALDSKAPLASPALTGVPTAPTATAGTNTTQVATTEFVTSVAVTKSDVGHLHAIANVTNLQSSLDSKAPLASPALTGVPTAPTATAGTNTTQVATTEFVTAATGAKANAVHTHSITDVANLQPTLETLAPLASPALVGIPTVPTAVAGTSTTQAASTAFVASAVSTHESAIDPHPQYTTTAEASAAAPVQSVAGKTGVVALVKADVGLGSVDNTADLAKNVLSATKLTNARTISATGDATWSVSFDGSANATAALAFSNSGVTAGTYNNSATTVTPFTVDAKGRVTGTSAAVTITPAWSNVTGKPTTLAGYGITDAINTSARGAVNGIASLDAAGLVPTSQLPSYVDDVLEYANLAALPVTGEAGKIYVTSGDNKIFRWSGSAYIEISPVAGNSDSATKLATARTISTTGDATWSVSFDGSANVSSAITLADSGASAGTYNNAATSITPFTIDAKGRVTGTGAAVTITPAWSSITGKPTTLSGYGITDAQALDADLTAIAGLAGTSGFLKKTAANTWSLDTASYITGNQTITVSGDVSGTGTTAISLTLANSGVTAGTYRSVTVDAKGRVTAGTNPTTLAGYGITDAVQSTGSMTLTDALVSTASLSTSTTAALQVVDTFAAGAYRTAKYMVQASSGTAYQVVEVLIVHNGTSVFMTEYGSVTTDTNLVTLDGDISAGNVRLLVTPSNATTTIRVVRTAIEV